MSVRPRSHASFFLFVIAAVILPMLSIGEAQERKFNFPHVRPLDASTRAAFSSGMKGSPLFRELVAQLEYSDLIIHVESDCTMRDRVQGKLIFVTAAGGVRYLRVRIGCAVSGASVFPREATPTARHSKAAPRSTPASVSFAT
jgi:hypothetical protein